MIVYPAVDLRNGKCVRLTQGDFATTKVYNNNPAAMLDKFAKFGATWLHMVDLDGAKQGAIAQGDLIKSLVASSNLKVQVGGGIRTTEDIERIFGYGASRVVLGSICVSNKELVKQWLDTYGSGRIVLALDCHLDKDGTPMVTTHGWQEKSIVTVWDLLDYYVTAKYVLCTDISVDGTLEGPSIDLYRELQERFPHISLIASGGVGSLDDLVKLKELNVYGVVVGKAIYEGEIPLEKIEFA